MMSIAERLAQLRDAIAQAERDAGRAPGGVRLVAASKGQPVSALREAAAAGQRVFGENYAREMRQKRLETATSFLNLEWHFIGRVQSGNAKEIASALLVHGVGSVDHAKALAKRGPVAALLQVSLWDEATKNGFTEAELHGDLQAMRAIDGIEIRGLMAMPPPDAEPRAAFARVRQLRDRLAAASGIALPELSMGMSGDFREAILEGATLVRVGTALFGPRPPRSTSAGEQEPA
jgi:PLP dependent protein